MAVRLDCGREQSVLAAMPMDAAVTDALLQALAERLENALDQLASAGVEEHLQIIVALCREATALAETGALLGRSD